MECGDKFSFSVELPLNLFYTYLKMELLFVWWNRVLYRYSNLIIWRANRLLVS